MNAPEELQVEPAAPLIEQDSPLSPIPAMVVPVRTVMV